MVVGPFLDDDVIIRIKRSNQPFDLGFGTADHHILDFRLRILDLKGKGLKAWHGARSTGLNNLLGKFGHDISTPRALRYAVYPEP